MASSEAIAKGFLLIRGSYPRYKFEKDTLFAYEILLKDIEDKLMLQAIAQVCRDNIWPPSVSEILAEAFNITDQRPSGIEAWTEVMQADGLWPDEGFSHLSIGEAVKNIGGMRAIVQSEHPEIMRRDFLLAYEEFRKQRQQEFRALPKLTETLNLLEALDNV